MWGKIVLDRHERTAPSKKIGDLYGPFITDILPIPSFKMSSWKPAWKKVINIRQLYRLETKNMLTAGLLLLPQDPLSPSMTFTFNLFLF